MKNYQESEEVEMDFVNNQFQVGDWVKINEGILRGCTGFIDNMDLEYFTVRVFITTDKNGKPSRGRTWFEMEHVEKLDVDLDEKSILTLIDLALDTKDVEWFEELSTKLPQELPW